MQMQIIIIAVALVLILLMKDIAAAAGCLAGGGIALTGSLAYCLVVVTGRRVSPATILHLHFIAWLAKLVGMFAALVLLYLLYRQIAWIWVAVGFFAGYSAYLFGLLFLKF